MVRYLAGKAHLMGYHHHGHALFGGTIPATREFMHGIRALTQKLGILMIMDEVKTGFRITMGGAQKYYDVTPDLTALGKVIGAGFPVGIGTTDTQNRIFEAQRRIIAELADRESCIIVGRCSDYILRNHPCLIRVFIYAPMEARYKNCIENLHMTPDQARKMIEDVDKARDAYHMHFSRYLPSDFNHNDIMINSAFLGIDGTAAYLTDLIHQRLSIQ